MRQSRAERKMMERQERVAERRINMSNATGNWQHQSDIDEYERQQHKQMSEQERAEQFIKTMEEVHRGRVSYLEGQVYSALEKNRALTAQIENLIAANAEKTEESRQLREQVIKLKDHIAGLETAFKLIGTQEDLKNEER